MSILVNPNIVPDILAGINQIQEQLNQADAELGSGRSINAPSDDPAGTAALILNHAEQSTTDTFQRNIGDLQNTMNVADSALNSAVNVINQAISLGVEAGNSDLSDQDRQAIANQLIGIQQELLGVANTSLGGNFLFGGTLVESQPFTLDGASPNGVDYNGNNSVTNVEIDNGQSVAVNVPGSQLFLNGAGNLFASLQQLIAAVQSNSGIAAANVALGQASTVFDSQRLAYGTVLNQLQTTNNFLSSQGLQLSTQESNIDQANIPQVVTQFSQAQVAYSALLQAESNVLNLPNILDLVH
jgi:flagellar hook-associated protein 3 FlgL